MENDKVNEIPLDVIEWGYFRSLFAIFSGSILAGALVALCMFAVPIIAALIGEGLF